MLLIVLNLKNPSILIIVIYICTLQLVKIKIEKEKNVRCLT